MRATLTSFLALAILLPATADEIADGQIVSVNADGSFDPEKQPLYFGFPSFDKWSVEPIEKSRELLLEGLIVSTNTGTRMQGVRVYVQYASGKPELQAISDADGRIKIRLQRERDVKGQCAAPLRRVYIGDPTSPGSFTRVFSIPKP